MCLLKVRISHGLHLGVSPHQKLRLFFLIIWDPQLQGSAPSFEKWSPSSFHSDDRGSVEDPSGYLGVGESDRQTNPALDKNLLGTRLCPGFCPGFLVKHRGVLSLFLASTIGSKKNARNLGAKSEFVVQNLVVLPQKSDIAHAVTARSAARPHRAPRPPADLLLGTNCAGAR